MSLPTMKRFLCLGQLSILLGILPATAFAAGSSRIYVTNRGGTTISIIDPETNKVVHEIKGFVSPEVARFSPDGNRIYIPSRADENELIVMDRKTEKIIKKIPLSGWANDEQVTPDGKYVLVCIRNTSATGAGMGALDIIDTATLTKIKSIPTPGLHDIAVTRDSKYAAAGSPPTQSLIVFDLQKLEIAWKVQYDGQGVQPLDIQSGPDGSGYRVFAQLSRTNGFSVVDFATRKEVARITHPDEPTGFGTACEGISHGIGVAPDGKTVWANSRPANSVFVYSLPDLKLLGHVSLPENKVPGKPNRGGGPAWVTFTPDSKTVYISTCGTKSVTAIDVKTIKKLAEIPVGEVPDRISTLPLP